MSASQRDRLLAVIGHDLQQDCEDCLALRDLMQALYGHLMSRDCERIDLLNGQIQPRVDAIAQRAERRSKVLKAFRLEAGPAGMQRLLGHFLPPQGEHLQRTWDELGLLLAQCKRLNERNGQLLAMHGDILNQLLADNRDPQLYDARLY